MPQKFSYESMGTHWEISIWDPECQGWSLADTKKEIISLSEEFDRAYSRFKKESLVWKIANGGAGTYGVPPDFLEMLKLYFDLYEISEKNLNPLIGWTISDLGYDADYSLISKEKIRKTPDLLETVEIIEEKIGGSKDGKIKVEEKVLFDFGALGKGYFVDKIANFLKSKGFNHFLVNGSGDIYYFGEKSIDVGLEDPDDPKKIIGEVEMQTGAMCASGINRRKWPNKNKEINHVIDPHSSSSQDEIVATWVLAPSCALTDALATCLFFCRPTNFSNYIFQYLIMNKNREVKYSPNLNVELY